MVRMKVSALVSTSFHLVSDEFHYSFKNRQVYLRNIVLNKCIILGLRIPLENTRNQGPERMRDNDPMRSFYVVDVDAIEEQNTEIYSMVIPCIVNYSGLRPVTGFRITLQHKTFASREWVQVNFYLYP